MHQADGRLRLGLIPDFREEKWPSMDLAADMLLEHIRAQHGGEFHAEALCPPFKRRFLQLGAFGSRKLAFNADRLLNRMRDYPRHLKKVRQEYDGFHVCDHAYANMVLALPAGQTGVFCHDLDTFRCLFEPGIEPRPRWFKAMMRRVLKGLEKAAVIFHSTQEIRRQIVARGIADEGRLVQAVYGVSPEFNPSDTPDTNSNAALDKVGDRPFILHVGSCIPRKRIGDLLLILAGLRERHGEICLVKAGGAFTPEQRERIKELGLTSSIVETGWQSERQLAALYRRAAATVVPSDAEGFGLPVIEALACGCAVVASAIETLMEVGEGAAMYRPVGGAAVWIETLDKILRDPAAAPPREARLRQAAKYSWGAHADTICGAYRRLLRG